MEQMKPNVVDSDMFAGRWPGYERSVYFYRYVQDVCLSLCLSLFSSGKKETEANGSSIHVQNQVFRFSSLRCSQSHSALWSLLHR